MKNHRNAAVGVYINNEHAVIALEHLIKGGLDKNKISIIGTAALKEDADSAFNTDSITNSPAVLGAVAGPILGLLSGIGMIALPGIGIIYGAGAVIGAIAGFNMGVITGGLLSLFFTFGIDEEDIVTYEDDLKKGKHLVIFHGDEEETKKAAGILEGGTALKVAAHYKSEKNVADRHV